jgi:hypothetical protein
VFSALAHIPIQPELRSVPPRTVRTPPGERLVDLGINLGVTTRSGDGHVHFRCGCNLRFVEGAYTYAVVCRLHADWRIDANLLRFL